MKVAVHGESGFSKRWLEQILQSGHVPCMVDGYSTNIMAKLAANDAFLWHLSQDEVNDLAFARSILLGAEAMGLGVFPNHTTCWHFDDKIAQKYLLEASGTPLAQTWVFFSKRSALEFLDQADFPLVFKLKRGAGSLNVSLVRDRNEGTLLVDRMFGRGISPFPPGERLRRVTARVSRKSLSKGSLGPRLARVARRFLLQSFRSQRERGYVYFQRYIPDNEFDVRVTTIGHRRFCFFRGVRDNDFRASGSGKIAYPSSEEIPLDMVGIAGDLSDRLGFQSMAYDFVRDPHDG